MILKNKTEISINGNLDDIMCDLLCIADHVREVLVNEFGRGIGNDLIDTILETAKIPKDIRDNMDREALEAIEDDVCKGVRK